MDLGEAVQTAVDAGLPLLLSTEASGELRDTVRIGRMKGRPGMLTITTSDASPRTTRRVVAEQSIAELRALKRAGANVTLSAGARQVGADDARATVGRRSGAARPPARDGSAEGRRIRLSTRPRLAPARRSAPAGRSHTEPPRSPGSRARRRRGSAARPVARGAHQRRSRARTATACAQRRAARGLR